MKEIGKIHAKAKEMVNLAHEACNKYNHAMQEASKATQRQSAYVQQTKDQLKA